MDNTGNSKSKTISCDDTQCSTKGEGGLQCIMRVYFVLRIVGGGVAAVHNVYGGWWQWVQCIMIQ